MKLIILGSGGFLPSDGAQTACYFLPEVAVLQDAGVLVFGSSARAVYFCRELLR